MTQYRFNTVCGKHDGVPIADCLSQNVTIDSAPEDESKNVTVATISMFQEGKISQIQRETSKDATLVRLPRVIQTGWPNQRAAIDQELYPYWIHRWNLSIEGVVMNGTRIVILSTLKDHCPITPKVTLILNMQ